MSDYTRDATRFTIKDGLGESDPNKVIYGADVDSELNAAATAINTKFDVSSDVTLTGVTGYDPNEHVDHTGVSVTAGEGLSGGGTIASTRNFDLSIAALTTTLGVAADPSDLLCVEDVSGGGTKKITITDAVAGTGFVPTSRSIASGSGIDGGGDLTANRTLSVTGGTGLTSNSTGLDLDQATDSALGGVELADQSEVDAGTEASKVVTPETLAAYSENPLLQIGAFSSDLIGFAATVPNVSFKWSLTQGRQCILTINGGTKTGTSNSSSFIISTSLPAELRPFTQVDTSLFVGVDNGVDVICYGNMQGNGTLAIAKADGTAWTTSGTKGFGGNVTIAWDAVPV